MKTAVIEFKDFSWKYKSSKRLVLDSINLIINQGEFVGIMGPTGAGKSTLCACINGLIPIKTRGWIKGYVKVFNINTRETKMTELGSKVGLVFQDPETQFIMMTVEDEIAIGLETLCIPREKIKDRIKWALKLVGLEGYEQKSPEELSGGQKQRVAIASIMAMRPEILILDEPTSDLDPKGKREVFELMEQRRREFNLTIILISHETRKIYQFCDRILVLSDGKIQFDGTPSEFIQRDEVFEKFGLYNPNQINQKSQLNSTLDYTLKSDKEALIKISGVSYVYPNNTQALNHISLEINNGDLIAIIGKNGSGKTTLIKQINGLLNPQSGKVFLKNKLISEYKASEIAQIIGFCYQNPDHQLFKNTIREEIEFGLKNLKFNQDMINKRYEEMIKLLDLQKFEDDYESTFYLSKGIRQRLALASVLALKPEILIIDEPTTGQDFKMIKEFMKILQELHAKNHTLILVTHNPYVISHYSKEVIILDEGKLIAKVPTKEFLKNKELQNVASFVPLKPLN